MKLIKVAAGALNQTPLDWDGNRANILAAIDAARRQEVSLLCLPELCLTGYGCEDAFHSPSVARTARELLDEIVAATAGMVVSLGLPLLVGGSLFNAAALAVDGRLVGFVGKQNLAGEGIHYEPRWFKPWPNDVRVEIDWGGRDLPCGDLMFDVGGVLVGFEICEDAWVANRPGGELSQRGADVLLNPSASHFAFGKQEVRERFVLDGSRAFCVNYIYANLLGNEAGRAIYDGGTLIAAAGKRLAVGRRFSFRTWELTPAVIDVDLTRTLRARTGSFRPVLASGRDDIVRTPFAWPEATPQPAARLADAWEAGTAVKEEEFARAVALGLFDYLRKSRSQSWIVSLSGGADSSSVAALCALAIDFAWRDLGPEQFRQRLAYIAALSQVADSRGATERLLTCVYQATRNSGAVTLRAARDVAEALGAEFLQFDVDSLVQDYVRIVAAALGRELTWDRDDVALQNIQARVRSPGVWLLANVRGGLLLSTSNRSEAAVGYATMDGDTSGGVAPIAGIDKAYLRRWLRWFEMSGPEGFGPLPAMKTVNDQQPTAELRPPSAGQTDEADLMPYEVLDQIERWAIRDKLSPLECYRQLRAERPDEAPAQVGQWVERFFRLWCRNQWKRERYAPSFHLDDANLDPKTWCRFPILSGGFERELAALRTVVASEPTP